MLHTDQPPAEAVEEVFRLIFTCQLDLWEIIRKDVYDDFRNAWLHKSANGRIRLQFNEYPSCSLFIFEEKQHIRITCPCDLYRFSPHFYIV